MKAFFKALLESMHEYPGAYVIIGIFLVSLYVIAVHSLNP